MINEAVILAGGLGTRLKAAVPELPKSMAGVAGFPFLTYIINYYRQQEISRFIFSLGYRHEAITSFLEKQFPDLDYVCSIEDEPLGTGGAIKKACGFATSGNIMVMNGDTLFEVSIREIAAFHENTGADCTLALKPMQNSERFGVVELEEGGRIRSFREKQWYEKSLINGGVYALNTARFAASAFPEKFSFEKDYLEVMYKKKSIYGIVQTGYFIDIGIPDDYQRAQVDFAGKQ